jgi:hypothetical protein
VEDRDTAGLYLEMSDVVADEYARTRVDAVLRLSGVERVTWWENACRDRTDLPRKLPEFSTLGVYEVTDEFAAPKAPERIAGHHFRRTPRPGQGRLTGRPTVGLMLVLISPRRAEQAQALRDWADFVHIRHIAEAGVPGYSMITPYENVTGSDPRFLHFYEMDTGDPEGAFRIMYVNTFRRLGERPA